jgi:hypothetical protein
VTSPAAVLAGDDAEDGGLAGAVRADQPDVLAVVEDEADAVEDRGRAVVLADIVEL